MRLWSISPQYLDTKGLLAAWREGLLAKKVLEGKTKGYINHPQLIRFKECQNSLLAINKYLMDLYLESVKRGFSFNKSKIGIIGESNTIVIRVNYGQVKYEYELLKWKLKKRDKKKYEELKNVDKINLNSVFTSVDGEIEKWEKVLQDIKRQFNV